MEDLRVLGAVIAGGKSRRMAGHEKALLNLGGITLIERIVSRLRLQSTDLVINANGDPSRFAHLGLPVIPDILPAVGTPLAGIHAALTEAQARGCDAVLSVPSDCPFIPLDLIARLAVAGGQTGAAVAASGGQIHYLTGLWSTAILTPLDRALRQQTLHRVQDMVELFETMPCEWTTSPHDPFFNINTHEDLAAAEAILHA